MLSHNGPVSDKPSMSICSHMYCFCTGRRCGRTLSVEIHEDLQQVFRQALMSGDVQLHVLYGVVLTLCHLGAKVWCGSMCVA